MQRHSFSIPAKISDMGMHHSIGQKGQLPFTLLCHFARFEESGIIQNESDKE